MPVEKTPSLGGTTSATPQPLGVPGLFAIFQPKKV